MRHADDARAGGVADPTTTGERVCASTGMVLVPAAAGTVWRIAKTSYGALGPPQRPLTGTRDGWGRYDAAGHRTVYGASTAQAAYAESLAVFRPKFTRDGLMLSDLFDDAGHTSLLDQVAAEWAEREHMPPGSLPAGWRSDRLLYQLSLPVTGWFVDVERAETIAALSAALGGELARFGLETLTTAHLRGDDRDVTTTVAGWIRDQVLDDGSLPHGIRFGSKHDSTWTCWAIWLRALDDGKDLTSEPTTAAAGLAIDDAAHNPDLNHVLTLFHLRCH